MDKIDATIFSGSSTFYNLNFEELLTKITICYSKMILDYSIIKDNENEIRDILLLNYLKNDLIREELKISQWLFEREVQEDNSVGRTDIKISTINTFETTDAYYLIECKRLNNKNLKGQGLNSEYIHNGVYRYTSRYYSSYYRVNAMIGFITKTLNINSNINILNELLKNYTAINTTKFITKSNFIPNFNYHYYSEHLDKKNEKLKIYHLMFDFSNNI